MSYQGYQTRKLKSEEIDEVLEWFTTRWGVSPPKNRLSDIALTVVDSEGQKCAVGWLYVTNSPVIYLEWTATNPSLGLSGLKALKYLVRSVQDYATANAKCQAIMQFLPSEKLADFYQKHLDFKVAERATIVVWNKGGS